MLSSDIPSINFLKYAFLKLDITACTFSDTRKKSRSIEAEFSSAVNQLQLKSLVGMERERSSSGCDDIGSTVGDRKQFEYDFKC